MSAPIGPFEGPVAWCAADLQKNEDWRVVLTSAERDELTQATKYALKRPGPLESLTIDDFPLPTLGDRIAGFRTALEGGRGFTFVQGLPVERFTDDEAKVLHWGFGQHLGMPEPQDKAGALLHTVTDTGARVETSDNIRSFQTNDELTFHTDGADVFALLCLRPAKTGGRSRLVSAVAVYNEILRQRPDLAAVLRAPFDFDARAQNPWEKKIQTVPIFTAHDGVISAIYKRLYIQLGQRFDEAPRLTHAQIEAMDMVDKLANDPAFHLALTMAPGDMQIANNATCFHARDDYEDFDTPEQKRCMLRLWLSLPNGRPLPKIFADTREWGPTYARRMQAAAE
jgi:hypothetical protein